MWLLLDGLDIALILFLINVKIPIKKIESFAANKSRDVDLVIDWINVGEIGWWMCGCGW